MDRALSDLDPIERNILRLAVYELLNNDLDKPIVINESVRLTKKYGAAEGYKYVNALIDKIAKDAAKTQMPCQVKNNIRVTIKTG